MVGSCWWPSLVRRRRGASFIGEHCATGWM